MPVALPLIGTYTPPSVRKGDRVFTDKMSHGHPDFHVILSTALTNWFRARPQFRLRCVVPIQKDGTTVELHAWFDAHVFAPTPASPPPVEQ